MPALAFASLFFTAIGIQQQVSASKDARRIADEQKKQGQAERALAEMRNRRAKVEEIRKGRIARASIVSSAETSGAGKSSGALGGASAVTSQTASNIGFLGAVNQTSQSIFESNQRISNISASQSKKLGRASIAGTLGTTFSPALTSLFK